MLGIAAGQSLCVREKRVSKGGSNQYTYHLASDSNRSIGSGRHPD